MYKLNRVGVVVVFKNEERQIEKTVLTIPEYVDKIILVDDASTDTTPEIVQNLAKLEGRIVNIIHEKNQGVGGAIATGYKWCRDNNIDISVVMAGDGQMDPVDMPIILDPIIEEGFDYTKANRLDFEGAKATMPPKRFWGNQILSFLTKIASGYYKTRDSQTGYTAINKKALKKIEWDKMYKRYGQPNDLLIKLNVHDFKVKNCIMKPVYGVGEVSQMKIKRVLFTIPLILFKGFIWRVWQKYFVQDIQLAGIAIFSSIAALFVALIFLAKILIQYTFFSEFPQNSFMIFINFFQLFCLLFIVGILLDFNNNKYLDK